MTDPATERAALALFEQSLDVPPGERDAWLVERTRDQPELAARVAAMRAADSIASLRTGAAVEEIEEEEAPERIGAYRIVDRIGRGGMGSVYRGERVAGDFAHDVAIKVIKPGLLSEALVDRFRRERQTLAQLRHPNIAQLHDGGETDAGAPYIVMELVEGEPLLAWAEAQGLARDARARLFETVCAAVAFAHRNLVVHRDITPSNILVTRDGTPKLIDFGIARPAEEGGAEDQAASSIGSLSLTPGYAAPERLRSTRVTTAADIYSLGKVLAALIPDRDDDLEAIVARATADAPASRYPTVEELADDVKAWRTGFPVAARGDSRSYLLRRFVARHRLGVAAAVGTVTLLAVALIVTLLANSRAEAARREAEQRFDQVHALSSYMLFELNGQLARVPGNTAARAALAERAQSYLRLLADSPGSPAALRLDTANGLIRLARIQGVPTEPNLGERDRAMANLEGAARLLEGVESESPRATTLRGLAEILQSLIVLHGNSEQDRARALLQAGERRLAAAPPAGRDGEWIDAVRALRTAQLEFADVAGERPRIPAIIEAMQRDRAAWPAPMRGGEAARVDDAQIAYYRGLLASESDQAEALRQHILAEQAYDALLQARRDDPLLLYRAAWNALDGFAAASQLGREDVSDRLIRRAAAVVDRLALIDDRDDAVRALQANINEGLSQNLRDADQFAPAITLQQRVVALREAAAVEQPNGRQLGNLGFSRMILGIIARDGGNRALACDSWRAALTAFERAKALNQIIGFHEGFMPGLRRNLGHCASGASIAGPLRD
jgi:eukaryotic-like serine/threonine-protein kinase